MNLTTATPAEIDTRLVTLTTNINYLLIKLDQQERIAALTALDYQREQAEAEADKLRAKIVPLRAEQNELDAEYNRRGGWARVWVVPNGHGHRDRTCHSLYADTVTVLVPRDMRGHDLSGATEDEIVAAVGERACTFCYPSAPVDRPSTIVLPDEDEKAKARAEREAKRQAAAAAKAAKAISHPDGSRIKHDGWYIDTEAEARRIYVQTHADAAWDAYRIGAERHAEKKAEVEHLLVAIAHKHGKDVEEMRAELEPKIKAKAKRDEREATKHAIALGLPLN